MLHEVLEGAESEPSDLLEAYETRLAEAIEAVGVETVVTEAELEREAVESMAAGEASERTVEEAARVLALVGDRDAETIVLELRDQLLLGMTTAVLDVDTIAANIDVDLTGQEVQQALEGRTPMTLDQLARVRAFIESRKP